MFINLSEHMKRLRDRRRIISVPVIHVDYEVQQTELSNLRRVQPESDCIPDEDQERLTADLQEEPSDVARRLWCQAGHF